MSKNNFLASKLVLAAILGFVITLFLACSEHSPLKFPEDENSSSSSSETADSSSSSEGSSSSDVSSSSESSSSSLKECEGSFNHNNKFCYDGTVYDKCDGLEYIPTSEICTETGVIIPARCGGNSYNPLTHYCHTDGETYSCGDKPYNPSTHFCYDNSNVVGFCGSRTQHYDPDKYECRAATNPNGIYLKGGLKDSRDNRTYDAVLIGEQTWMAANLNYKTSNNASRCYPLTGNSNSNDNENTNCTNADGTTNYGRLYNWVTVMNGESPSYANPSGVQGICPSGWHLPSNDEWETLDSYVKNDIECDNCAGTKLKVKNWPAGTFNGVSYPVGEDYYGWAGRAGGSAAAATNSFVNLGMWSNYWNASHNSSDNTKSCSASLGPLEYLATANCDLPRVCYYSVRCIQDKEN